MARVRVSVSIHDLDSDLVDCTKWTKFVLVPTIVYYLPIL